MPRATTLFTSFSHGDDIASREAAADAAPPERILASRRYHITPQKRRRMFDCDADATVRLPRFFRAAKDASLQTCAAQAECLIERW